VPISDLRITNLLVVSAFLAITTGTTAGATTVATTALDFFTGIGQFIKVNED
jgi:hypothetical protein